MILKKTYFVEVISSIITTYATKNFFLVLILLPLFFVSVGFQTISHANASSNLGDSIDQFRNNLQSSIDREIQSNANNDNNNNVNCDSNTNFSIQSQTNDNGQTTSTSKTSCGASTSTISSLSLNNVNLKGAIVSTEYNTTTGVIVNSLFGNWSLTTRDGNSNGFNSSFTKQPVFYNSSNAVLSNSAANGTEVNNQTQLTTKNQYSNLTSYDLSNFRVNAVNQQNNDTTYHGKIDVVREKRSLATDRPDETNTFKDINISVSILGNRILVINFDNQTELRNDFANIPLVGIVK